MSCGLPRTKSGPRGEGWAAREGPVSHKHNPSYSLWPFPSILFTFLGGPWGQLLSSLKIAQSAFGCEGTPLACNPRGLADGSWCLWSLQAYEIRFSFLSASPSSSPNLRFAKHHLLLSPVSQGILFRGSHSG